MNLEELLVYLFTPIAQVAIIIGLAELVKKNNYIPTKYVPLFDIMLGMLSGIGVYGIYLNKGIIPGIMLGLAIGLSACGLFSGIKNTLNK